MKCPQCSHTETLVYGKTRKGVARYICPMCHETFTDKSRVDYTPLHINLLNFRDRLFPAPTESTPLAEATALPLGQQIVDFGIIAAFTIAQCIWMTLFTSTPRVGLVNLLPTFVFLVIWYFFAKFNLNKQYFWWCFAIAFVLTLRLPLTISRQFEAFSWVAYIGLIGIVFSKIATYFQKKRQFLILSITCLVILYNSFAHVSLNSPYSYVFRVRDNLPSAYMPGVASIKTFECPYENPNIVTSCDMGTYMDIEKIFTDPKFDNAKDNFYIRRFFYSYLSSLVGFEGHRWIASFTLNMLFWLLASVAIFDACILCNLNQRVAAIAMLCSASSWGFIHFVGQPGPYLASYALSSTMLWATFKIVFNTGSQKVLLYSPLILVGATVYDIFPTTVACLFVLFMQRKAILAATLLILQILIAFLWRNFFNGVVLGATGSTVTSELMTNSLQTWIDILTQLNFSKVLEFIEKGILTYLYGGMIFGVLASLIFWVYLFAFWRSKENTDKPLLDWLPYTHQIKLNIIGKIKLDRGSDFRISSKILLFASLSSSILLMLAAIMLTPELVKTWTPPTGLQPRFAFYSYPINTIALVFICYGLGKKYAYILPCLTFIIANIDITGLVSVPLFFDFGRIGIYWR